MADGEGVLGRYLENQVLGWRSFKPIRSTWKRQWARDYQQCHAKWKTSQRLIWFNNDFPIIHCRVEGRAAERHSVTIRFLTDIFASKLIMDTPGGVTSRPILRIYNPTFWPLQHFIHLQDDVDGSGLLLFIVVPEAISYQSDGSIDLVAFRNATQEKVFVISNIPGNTAPGHEKQTIILITLSVLPGMLIGRGMTFLILQEVLKIPQGITLIVRSCAIFLLQ